MLSNELFAASHSCRFLVEPSIPVKAHGQASSLAANLHSS